ncbi:MAG: bacillithiol biosynthesis deacetylase BshB1 [Candidatus Hydrogenedentes bacterium]|nr:bacillithiol biosynthesis deacetylase BshB1 [Candidatus Hydrogenedentota bacterium]
MSVDVLAIGAHPDDVELGVGGLIHKLTQSGRSVAILDLTRGELATRGSIDERRSEALAAARILGALKRENAALPDGGITNTREQQLAVVRFIRSARPRIIVAPMSDDRHPDHGAAHVLTRDANFFAGLRKIDTGHEPYRAPRMYFYRVHAESSMPQLVVDISAHFGAKLEAVRAYASQFHNPAYDGEQTFISTPEFWESIRTKAAYWGAQIGVSYGEALHADSPVGIELLPGLEDTSL